MIRAISITSSIRVSKEIKMILLEGGVSMARGSGEQTVAKEPL
jgi:hypothetical protein